MARIAGFHPAGPGSIPGTGDHLFPFCISTTKGLFPNVSLLCSLLFGGESASISQLLAKVRALAFDEVAEWLRRWTANPMCSARVGSNPILVGKLFFLSQRLVTERESKQ